MFVLTSLFIYGASDALLDAHIFTMQFDSSKVNSEIEISIVMIFFTIISYLMYRILKIIVDKYNSSISEFVIAIIVYPIKLVKKIAVGVNKELKNEDNDKIVKE